MTTLSVEHGFAVIDHDPDMEWLFGIYAHEIGEWLAHFCVLRLRLITSLKIAHPGWSASIQLSLNREPSAGNVGRFHDAHLSAVLSPETLDACIAMCAGLQTGVLGSNEDPITIGLGVQAGQSLLLTVGADPPRLADPAPGEPTEGVGERIISLLRQIHDPERLRAAHELTDFVAGIELPEEYDIELAIETIEDALDGIPDLIALIRKIYGQPRLDG